MAAKVKPISPRATLFLRLIAQACQRFVCWQPFDKRVSVNDDLSYETLFIDGAGDVAILKALETRGLTERPPETDSLQKYRYRITPKGIEEVQRIIAARKLPENEPRCNDVECPKHKTCERRVQTVNRSTDRKETLRDLEGGDCKHYIPIP